jgi:hypothetical protein
MGIGVMMKGKTTEILARPAVLPVTTLHPLFIPSLCLAAEDLGETDVPPEMEAAHGSGKAAGAHGVYPLRVPSVCVFCYKTNLTK